jgi:hypothetical protein
MERSAESNCPSRLVARMHPRAFPQSKERTAFQVAALYDTFQCWLVLPRSGAVTIPLHGVGSTEVSLGILQSLAILPIVRMKMMP